MDENTKVYINGIFIKAHTFANGGQVLNVGIKTDEFCEELQKHKSESGYTNLKIGERREPSETGITHHCSLDTFEPSKNNEKKAPAKPEDDDLPF